MKANDTVIFDVDAQLDEFFGKEGTPERRAAEERANAFFTEPKKSARSLQFCHNIFNKYQTGHNL